MSTGRPAVPTPGEHDGVRRTLRGVLRAAARASALLPARAAAASGVNPSTDGRDLANGAYTRLIRALQESQ